MMNEVILTLEKKDEQIIAEMESLRAEYFNLVVHCDTHDPPFIYRRCRAEPTKDQQKMIAALSGGRDGVRSFSGQSFRGGACDKSYYLGWNKWGFGFYMPSTYCQVCGYAMDTVCEAKKVIIDASKVSKVSIENIKQVCQRVDVEGEIQNIEG